MSKERGLYLEDFAVEQRFVTAARTVTEADIVIFTGLSGDFNPLHTDEEFCRSNQFGTRIAQGLLGTSIASGLTAQTGLLNGTAIGFLGMTWKFTGAIRAGDTIHVVMTVKEARASSKPGRGVLVRQIDVLNQRNEVVQTGEWAVLIKTRPDVPSR
jgi:acyl dehydratase